MSVQSELPNSGEMLQRPAILLQDAGTTDMVLTELAGNHMARDGGLVEGSLQMKNALQSQAVAPPQQKLNRRRYSVNVGFKHPGQSKRRRRANSECDPVLPTNFLLGGNIFDPLNLNSLLDEKVNKALNAQTPKSSPLPVKNRDPVEILIPKDITDPLNLGGDAGTGVLLSPVKSRRRHRNRHHGAVVVGLTGQLDPSHSEKSKVSEGAVSGLSFSPISTPGTEADVSAESTVKESPRPYELNTSINCRDEVVQPILPRRRSHPSSSSSAPQTQPRPACSAVQPSKHRKRRRTSSRSDRLSITPTPSTKQTIAAKAHSQAFHTPVVGGGAFPSVTRRIQLNPRRPRRNFQHGTCSRYYGYRTPALNADPRLAVFRPEWFHGKKVLDVGCNTGHITLAIARHWSPAHIMGVDIEEELVHAARLNLRHFLSELCGQQESHRTPTDVSGEIGEGSEVTGEGLPPLMKLEQAQAFRRFPLSFTRCRGPIASPPIMRHIPGLFPSNLFFMQGNYVPDSDAAVMSQREEYDVILCLSLTKWVHLNFGDAGIQRLFHRVYRHLLPGGLLILEPQPWSSYSRRKRLTEVTHRNYSSIRLKPDHFSSYLTSDVGFNCYELLETSQNSHKGSQRPVYLFHKGSSNNRK
ncbi:7SK snRNA methylphosphate capping enzyme [Triplophysa rosa]|uniref:RNA methyltransferase n=1 Tax=Triplophysa rosa TaxID=992332 RepID=A0A9W7WBF8_TRIRA|nr:7SK snRNA methylphosphate capping enzyme [Triplophysa rosa]KAI7793936.1 putative 7SK snRNA methylphosphate capping enzyme-like [Triplophysa rosa]